MRCTLCYSTDMYEVRYVGGPNNGQVQQQHICGVHRMHNHDHQGAYSSGGWFIEEHKLPNGIYIQYFSEYRIACNPVDNFVTMQYDKLVAVQHGHPYGQPCYCFEKGLE